MSKNIIGKFIYNPTVNDTKEANTQIPTKTMLNFLYEGNNLHIEIISHRYPNIPNKPRSIILSIYNRLLLNILYVINQKYGLNL